MRRSRQVPRAQAPVAGALLAAALLGGAALVAVLAGCGDDEAAAPTTRSTVTTTETAQPPAEAEAQPGGGEDRGASESAPPPPGKPAGPAESGDRDPRQTARERAAARTVRELVAALDAGDGARVCALLAPGAVEAVDLPRERGGCAASLSASIGYRDPRGFPVWEGAEVSAIQSVEIDAGRAKVVATTATTFADRDEVSIEDDVVYLARERGRWLVAKPSSTVYRAVGIADVPPSVLAPPDGVG